MESIELQNIPIPFLKGNPDLSFRDPCAIFHNDKLWVYYSLVRREERNRFYWYVAFSTTTDFISWTEPRIITNRGLDLNYSSPGNIIRYGNKWIICLQTLPTPEKFRKDPEHVFPSPDDPFHVTGDQHSRIWIMESEDLTSWGEPRLLRVKGPDIPQADMGRMIDAYLLQDKDQHSLWWCFFKQNGMSLARSRDLEHWTFVGSVEMGENVCVLPKDNEYVVFHSPKNGIGVKRTCNFEKWIDDGILTLGQSDWPWAAKRLTAGFVIDLRHIRKIGKYLMMFHGSSQKWNKNRNAHGHCSLGMAWSDDLVKWDWPNNH